jgi:hypothetical protein
MNAPVRPQQLVELDDLENLAEEFAECCEIQVWFVNEGWISKQRAVDNLQHLIESLKVPDEDRDVAQAIMAEAFAPGDAVEDVNLPSDYAAQLVSQWTLADPRDAWSLTCDRPPTDAIRNSAIFDPVFRPRRFSPPQATIDAFKYVVALGNPDHLARWLRDHSDVAAALLKEVGQC